MKDNDFTKEEQEILDRLKKPLFTFDEIQKEMDEQARKLGYEDHKDFLIKTGWLERFNVDTV